MTNSTDRSPTLATPMILTTEMTSLPVTAVTVFADRAEVKRTLKTELQPGEYEVIFHKLSKSIEQKSIRVEGRGIANLGNITYGSAKQEGVHPEAQKKEHLNKLRSDRTVRRNLMKRLSKKRDTLDGIIEKIGRTSEPSRDEPPIPPFPVKPCRFDFPDGYLADLDEFFKYYDRRAADFDDQLLQVANEIRNFDNEIDREEEQLRQLTSSEPMCLMVKLQVKNAGEIELHVSYIVKDATWEPSYDILIETSNRKPKLCYFGLVKQATGETWSEGAKLCLSTINTNIDGHIPKLAMLQIDAIQLPPPKTEEKTKKAKDDSENERKDDLSDNMPAYQSLQASSKFFPPGKAPPPPPPKMSVVEAKMEKAVIGASFQAARLSTIPPDGSFHKIAIMEISLTPTSLEYMAIPSVRAVAYLVAHVKNTSEFPLMAAPCFIFWDNTFTGESHLEDVSPQEEFACCLGVDASVHVDYKAAKIYKEETPKTNVQTRGQKIRIKNTRMEAIAISVADRYPVSNDEKIKVELLEPKPGNEIKVNEANGRVEWKLQIPGGQEEMLSLKYRIEHPKDIQLDQKEVKE